MKRYEVMGTGSIRMMGGADPKKCRKWQLVAKVRDMEQGGKQRRITRTFPSSAQRRQGVKGTRREAEKALREFVLALDAEEVVSACDMTFAEYSRQWLDARRDSGQFSPRTIQGDESCLKAVCEMIGDVPLRNVDARTLERMYADLRNGRRPNGKPLAPSTLKNFHSVIMSMLHRAVELRDLPMDALLGMHAPKCGPTDRRAMTDEQAAEFIAKLKPNDPRHAALMLCITMGLRRSEALRAEWGDLHDGLLEIYDNLDNAGRPIGRPKTTASISSVPVPPATAEFLEEWKATQARVLDQTDATPICSATGKFIPPVQLSMWWQRNRAKKFGTDLKIHELRHTYITMLARRNVHPRVMQALARQATMSITMGIYTHVQDEQKRQAVARLDIFGGNRAQKQDEA